MKRKTLSTTIASVFIAATSISAGDAIAGKTFEKDKFAVGFQSGFAAWGLSGKMKVNEKITAQGIIGAFGTLTHFGARGLYNLKSEQFWDAYGFGTVGIWTWDGSFIEDKETAFGFGGGAGIEYDWRAFAPELPPIYWNIEAGIGTVGFDHYGGFSSFGIGVGAHYRF